MIFTLTLNPAFDIYYNAENLVPGSEIRVKKIGRYLGGKGINVSAALSALGEKNRAFALIGEDSCDEVLSLAQKRGVNLSIACVKGKVRENITVIEKSGRETRMSTDSFEFENKGFVNIENQILSDIKNGDIFVFSGSIPPGEGKKAVVPMLSEIRKKGVKTVVDSKSFGIEDIEEIKPWLIKPNEEEVCTLFGNINVCAAAERLKESGCENVLISLGENGAYFCGKDKFFVNAAKIAPKSTVGAGDSMTAGFICGFENNLSERASVRLAVAVGSAACLKEGTEPPDKEEVKKLLENL